MRAIVFSPDLRREEEPQRRQMLPELYSSWLSVRRNVVAMLFRAFGKHEFTLLVNAIATSWNGSHEP
jgi:hypothetical protein